MTNPKTDWKVALHIYDALGDLFINKSEYENAIFYYNQALKCPDGVDSGYIWLDLGQAYYEDNNIDKAKDALMSAYMLEGKNIFEDEDSKSFKPPKKVNEMFSVALTKEEHQLFTNAWRKKFPYGKPKPLQKEIEDAAREIYKNYPELLKKLGL